MKNLYVGFRLNVVKISRNRQNIVHRYYFSAPFSFLQETKSGKRRIIATACIDLADYISEIEKTFDITVTLKPANKNILSGSLEFTLTSVLLEDGIP